MFCSQPLLAQTPVEDSWKSIALAPMNLSHTHNMPWCYIQLCLAPGLRLCSSLQILPTYLMKEKTCSLLDLSMNKKLSHKTVDQYLWKSITSLVRSRRLLMLRWMVRSLCFDWWEILWYCNRELSRIRPILSSWRSHQLLSIEYTRILSIQL